MISEKRSEQKAFTHVDSLTVPNEFNVFAVFPSILKAMFSFLFTSSELGIETVESH